MSLYCPSVDSIYLKSAALRRLSVIFHNIYYDMSHYIVASSCADFHGIDGQKTKGEVQETKSDGPYFFLGRDGQS